MVQAPPLSQTAPVPPQHLEALLKESFERITALYEAGAELTGIPSGYRDLDRLTSGFQPGNLVIVAARPSMGKSALGLGMAANLAVRCETPVALFTLEMSKAEVTQRLMCSEAKVESQRLRTGKLAADDWPRLTAACDKLAKAPIYVDESGSIEQDADLVIFIYRDEYYNEDSDQQGLAEVILAKHRNGPTDSVKLSFLKRYAKFADLAAT